MASIRREVSIEVSADTLWDALKDVGSLHTRLVKGFVTDCRLEGKARIVTFANGVVAKELIVSIDEADRRLVWSAVGGRLTHHNASAQVFAESASRSRLVWIADLLPDELAPTIAGMIEAGTAAMKQSMENGSSHTATGSA
jgi:G3E family GTPase